MAAHPPLPPLHARARRVLVAAVAAAVAGAGLGYLVAIWPAPEPFRAPFLRSSDTALYPIDVWAAPLRQDPRCLLFLDQWMRHPSWQLTITRGAEDGCGNSGTIADSDDFLTLDSAGFATWWSRDGQRQTMHLPPPLLERLHRAATASCSYPDPAVTEHWDLRFVSVRWGGTVEAPGPTIWAGSDAFAELTRFVDDARRVDD